MNCLCGCGRDAGIAGRTRNERNLVKGQPRLYYKNHGNRLRLQGAQRGKSRVNHHGYVRIRIGREHPYFCMAWKDGAIMEHRLNMAEHLGRPLTSIEVVHHENRIKTDNRIENLKLFATEADHERYHRKQEIEFQDKPLL